MEVLTEEINEIPSVVNTWPLMGSPAPIACIFASYLVLVLKVLPKYMETRKPFNLANFTRVYNILQVVVCSFFVMWSIEWGFSFRTTWQCVKDPVGEDKMTYYKKMQWWFLWLRLAELVETVVFVLRKKQNQVSTLHVYHHISTASIVWIFLKYCTSPMDAHTAIINSCVHIVMYFYYFLSSFKEINKQLGVVKPFITSIQLLQLVIILGHNIVPLLPSCNVSKIFYIQIVNAAILIYFFAEFYVKSYKKKKQN